MDPKGMPKTLMPTTWVQKLDGVKTVKATQNKTNTQLLLAFEKQMGIKKFLLFIFVYTLHRFTHIGKT